MASVDSEVSRGTQLLLSTQADVVAGIDRLFDQLLRVPADPRGPLYEAMRHAAIAGGKRLRPLLVRAAGDLFHVDRALTLRVGAAVEAMHVYSLIHDDLPCMDDDDMRRGKPTVHKAYNEATAVLAGDSLHALAFEWLCDRVTSPDPFVRGELCCELARAAGPAGMAGGQMMDLAAETSNFDLPTVTRLQQLKTGALTAKFRAARNCSCPRRPMSSRASTACSTNCCAYPPTRAVRCMKRCATQRLPAASGYVRCWCAPLATCSTSIAR